MPSSNSITGCACCNVYCMFNRIIPFDCDCCDYYDINSSIDNNFDYGVISTSFYDDIRENNTFSWFHELIPFWCAFNGCMPKCYCCMIDCI